MTSDSQSEQDSAADRNLSGQYKGENTFKPVRIDQGESDEIRKPNYGQDHIKGRRDKVGAGKFRAMNRKAISSEGNSTEANSELPGVLNEHAELVKQGSQSVIEKMKLFQDLNHFLDDLNLRIKDLEAREYYLSHSLLLLDHERRQFRLWKSQEIMVLEHRRQEWELSNYGFPPVKAEPQLSADDQEIMQELKFKVPAVEELKAVAQVINMEEKVEVSKPVIKQERIYILDVVHDAIDKEVTAAPQITLPDKSLMALEIEDNITQQSEQREESQEFETEQLTEEVTINYLEVTEETVLTQEVQSQTVENSLENISLEIPTETEAFSEVENFFVESEPFIEAEVYEEVQNLDEPIEAEQNVSPVIAAAVPEFQIPEPQIIVQTIEKIPEGYISQEEFLRQQQEWEQLREQQLEDLERRQKLSLKQIRFQREHLEKLRREFEIERNESLFEMQQIQNRLQESALILDMQQNQYKQARQLLDERADSIEREEFIHRELARLAREQHQQAEIEVEYIYSLEERLKNAMNLQEQEFKRQEDQLKSLQMSFTPRMSQLVEMKSDVEKAHRETLVIREALDRAWKQIKGDELFSELEKAYSENQSSLTQTVEERFAENLERMENLKVQNLELLNLLEGSLRTNLEVLETIRQELPILIPPVSDLQANEHEVTLNERQLWLEEKLDAERIIRQLVDQLEDRLMQIKLDQSGSQAEAA